MDPLVVKILLYVLTTVFTILLGAVAFFLKRNIQVVDNLNQLIHALENKLTEQSVRSQDTYKDVEELKDRHMNTEREVADLKLKVNEHDVILNIRKNAN